MPAGVFRSKSTQFRQQRAPPRSSALPTAPFVGAGDCTIEIIAGECRKLFVARVLCGENGGDDEASLFGEQVAMCVRGFPDQALGPQPRDLA